MKQLTEARRAEAIALIARATNLGGREPSVASVRENWYWRGIAGVPSITGAKATWKLESFPSYGMNIRAQFGSRASLIAFREIVAFMNGNRSLFAPVGLVELERERPRKKRKPKAKPKAKRKLRAV